MTRALPWLGLIAAPAAWSAQLVVGYGVEEASCPTTGDAVTASLAAVTVAAAIIAVAGLLAALFATRDPRPERHATRVRFMGAAGLVGSATFLLAIVLGGVAVATLDPCAIA